MALRALVLLHVIHQDLQPAIHSAVVQVESESPYLEGLAATLVLTSVDTSIELPKYLVIPSEKCTIEDLRVPEVDRWLERLRSDDDAFFLCSELLKRRSTSTE
jgi:hypothetical protein